MTKKTPDQLKTLALFDILIDLGGEKKGKKNPIRLQVHIELDTDTIELGCEPLRESIEINMPKKHKRPSRSNSQ